MQNSNYYVGEFRKDSIEGPNFGWIIGRFMKDPPRKNEEVEIKYWEFKVDEESNHPKKVSSIIECTFVLSGKLKAIIDNEEIILKQGDYIVIKPGIMNNTISQVLENATGLTIKAPSDLNTKTILE